MEEQKKQGGKKPGQKFKSLLVWDILQKRTDENHAISLKEIVEHLKMYGITAERHSINTHNFLIYSEKHYEIKTLSKKSGHTAFAVCPVSLGFPHRIADLGDIFIGVSRLMRADMVDIEHGAVKGIAVV